MNTALHLATQLSDRQERFIHEYLIDQNARAAARRAGYSDKSNGSQAAELMRNPRVKERIREGLEELFAGLKITARNLLQHQARIAFFDPRKLFDKTGAPIALDELDEESASVLLVSYGERKNGDWTRRVRQPSRMQALANLERRYLKFLEMQWNEGEEEDEPKAKAVAGPAPVATAPPAVATLASVVTPPRPVAAAPDAASAQDGGPMRLLRALWPAWLRDKAETAKPAARAKALPKKKKDAPAKEIPFHMQFAHLDPPNLAALKNVPYEEWPEKARKYYRPMRPDEPLPPYMTKPRRQLYGDPGPVFRDD